MHICGGLYTYFIIWNKTQMTHFGKYDGIFAYVINAREMILIYDKYLQYSYQVVYLVSFCFLESSHDISIFWLFGKKYFFFLLSTMKENKKGTRFIFNFFSIIDYHISSNVLKLLIVIIDIFDESEFKFEND